MRTPPCCVFFLFTLVDNLGLYFIVINCNDLKRHTAGITLNNIAYFKV